MCSLCSKCRFDIVCFTIQHSSLRNSAFKFTQFNIQVYTIQHSSLRNSAFKFTQFNIQVYAIQHPCLRNSTFKFTQFNIQVFAIPHPSLRNSTSNHREHTILLNRERVNKGTKRMNSLSLSPLVISFILRDIYWEHCCLQILRNTEALNSYQGLSVLSKNFFGFV